ncbi:MAG: hypothetical protein HYR60_30840, partial [Acidobacteria bacterium]|nr:hypothetical protein [Acidobacteriota bacterium]
WTVNPPPVAVSVAPSSGSGAAQTFVFTFSDGNGFADITRVNMNVNLTLTSVGGCYLEYTRATNTLLLANDAGDAWAASAVLGSAATLQNSRCSINAATASASGSGNLLTVSLPITFKPGFSGAKNLYLAALDSLSSFSGWQALGTWTVP